MNRLMLISFIFTISTQSLAGQTELEKHPDFITLTNKATEQERLSWLRTYYHRSNFPDTGER